MNKLAVIVSLLIIIYLLTLREPPVKEISNISEGELVRVKGKIINYTARDRTTFLTISNGNKSLNVVFFKHVPALTGYVIIKGRVKTYKGKLEMTGVDLKSLK